MDPSGLPITSLAQDISACAGSEPLVISSPTGSGKSTQVPRYCSGRVLVVEPRRVACRGLAARVAQLEGSALGDVVGYRVRDDACHGATTRVLFVTPGVALRMWASFSQYHVIILDEFHERSMEVDLLFSLLRRDHPQRLVVMSATLEAERLAAALSARHLSAQGRVYPVSIEYRADEALLPSPERLCERVLSAVQEALAGDQDVLVFLPGKAEITATQALLSSQLRGAALLPLHGALSLQQQAAIFSPGPGQRVILATNVAETSLTVPGIGVVVDSGLLRRTRYHYGRGYLALLPVAADSAEQRAGRAGRTGPGRCIRLWSEAAKLAAVTAPELHRESLAPLLLAAACGARVEALPFLDPPKAHAVDDARTDLRALGALGAGDELTEVGSELFSLPLDPALARLVSVARPSACGACSACRRRRSRACRSIGKP